MNGPRTNACVPEALHGAAGEAYNKSLREIELDDSGEQENKKHRHGAGDARQRHLEAGGRYRQSEIDQEARKIRCVPVQQAVAERRYPESDYETDIKSGS